MESPCIKGVNVAQSYVKITKMEALLRTQTIYFFTKYFVRTGNPGNLREKKPEY